MIDEKYIESLRAHWKPRKTVYTDCSRRMNPRGSQDQEASLFTRFFQNES